MGIAIISDVNPCGVYSAGDKSRGYKKRRDDRLLETRIQQLRLTLMMRLFFRFIRFTKIIMISGVVNLLSFISSFSAAEAVFGGLSIAVQ